MAVQTVESERLEFYVQLRNSSADEIVNVNFFYTFTTTLT